MNTWAQRVAARFVPAPMTFEEFAEQHPTDLVDLVACAQGRPVRTVEQHYAEYVARHNDPVAQAETARLLAEAQRRNEIERRRLHDEAYLMGEHHG